MDDLMKDFEEFVKTEKDELKNDTVLNEYKNFLDANEDSLNDEFGKIYSLLLFVFLFLVFFIMRKKFIN